MGGRKQRNTGIISIIYTFELILIQMVKVRDFYSHCLQNTANVFQKSLIFHVNLEFSVFKFYTGYLFSVKIWICAYFSLQFNVNDYFLVNLNYTDQFDELITSLNVEFLYEISFCKFIK